MKQKKLMALMLAAAMAVTSLTLPGGVLEPETVYAYEKKDITFGTYDSATGTLSATVPSDAADEVQYSINYGVSWRTDGLTVNNGTVTVQLPAGNYDADDIMLRFKSNESSCKCYGQAVKVGYDAAADIANGTLQVLVNGETVLENNKKFDYTGSPVITSVKVVKNGETAELVEGSEAVYTYNFKDSDGKTMYTETPTEEGTYTLHIYPRTFDSVNHTGYGEYKFTFTIAKKQLKEDEVKELVAYTNQDLTYDGTDQSGTVQKVIGLSDKGTSEGYKIDSVTFKKDNVECTEVKNVGAYAVYVKVLNKMSSGTASVGFVVMKKYQPTVKDFEITGGKFTYDGTAKSATVVPKNELLSKENIKVEYIKDGSSRCENPEDAGTYRVFVAYIDDGNCATPDGVDTGVDLVINKKVVSPVVDATVVKADTAGSTEVDLSSVTDKYGSIIEDKVKITTGSGIKTAMYSNGDITFELDDEGKGATTSMETAITVDLSEALENYSAILEIPITIVPADTQIAPITLNDAEFTYDGEAKALEYSVSNGTSLIAENVTAGALNKNPHFTMTETITKNGVKVKEIKDAGTYVVTAELKYDGEGNAQAYGKLIKEVTVKPATMTNATKYFKLEESNLTYDGKSNFAEEICALVTASSAGIEKEDYDVRLSTETLDGGVRNAGYVTVYVKMLGGNYTTTDWLELGTVYINKASASNLTITDDGKGNLTVKLGDLEISEGLTISYCAKGSTEILWVKPTAKGEYTAKIKTSNLNFTQDDVKEYSYKIGGSSSSSSSSSSSTDSSKETTKSETTASGTTVTTTEEKNDDGTSTVEKKLENKTTGEEATVTVEKDASGNVTEAAAAVTEKSTEGETTISADTVADIKEAAGTDDVTITTKTVDANGNVLREVSVNASDLTAGKKLKVVEVNKETGEETLVNASTYKVAADGSLLLDNLGNASYELVSTAAEKALTNKVLKTVKVAKASATVAAGKKTTIKLSKKLNMDNVKKIIYTSTKKSVATVSKTGKITAKKAGKVTIKAKVVLNNGKTKIVSMKIKVKAKK